MQLARGEPGDAAAADVVSGTSWRAEGDPEAGALGMQTALMQAASGKVRRRRE